MIDDLFSLSRHFLNACNREYKRYFLKKYALENRFNIITGQRGVGKTTAIVQHLLSKYDNYTRKALYLPVDHFVFGKRNLYETTEEFHNLGGELICFDEIHKYADWSRELKSIYDSFPRLEIIASGSSTMKIQKESSDLSRRAVIYSMLGLSLREFLGLKLNLELDAYSLDDILSRHEEIATNVVKKLDDHGAKILGIFKEYLRTGYYPYFLEFSDPSLCYIVLEQGIHTTIESDLLAVYPSLSGTSIKKIKRLLSVIAESVPFTPDLKMLKRIIDVGDERTLKNYLNYLEDGGIILNLTKKGSKIKALEKPEKIYLNNPSQIYALSPKGRENIGNIRETFFINMLGSSHTVIAAKHGDFGVDERFTFEIGGKKKGFSQVRDIPDSFLALDDMEIGIGKKIPLWLFGFLY